MTVICDDCGHDRADKHTIDDCFKNLKHDRDQARNERDAEKAKNEHLSASTTLMHRQLANESRTYLTVVRERDQAVALAARLRADFPPAPPLPEAGCSCSACQRLREMQTRDRAVAR
jgi:hypothetical protein